MSGPKWIRFDLRPQDPSRKTQTWNVIAKRGGDILGTVAWYSGWRRYVFQPYPGTEYEQDCLRDIADFIQAETQRQKSTTPASAAGRGEES